MKALRWTVYSRGHKLKSSRRLVGVGELALLASGGRQSSPKAEGKISASQCLRPLLRSNCVGQSLAGWPSRSSSWAAQRRARARGSKLMCLSLSLARLLGGSLACCAGPSGETISILARPPRRRHNLRAAKATMRPASQPASQQASSRERPARDWQQRRTTTSE